MAAVVPLFAIVCQRPVLLLLLQLTTVVSRHPVTINLGVVHRLRMAAVTVVMLLLLTMFHLILFFLLFILVLILRLLT